ncbi:3509_t:CDS:1, partial [Paraglomus occultum]
MTTLLFRALQISNVLSFLLATSVNIWGLTRSPNNIVDIFDQNPTYFTPVKIFVLIFWVIWFLSFVTFVFYAQWIEEVTIMEVVGKGVGLLFVMSNVFLYGWVWFW